jgi:capsid protein
MGFFSFLFGKAFAGSHRQTFKNGSRTFSVQASSPSPGPATVNAGMANYYEALRGSKDRTAITPPPLNPKYRALVQSLNRERLAALARYLYDNVGFVGYAVNSIANYSVPVIPRAQSPKTEWNKLADDWWTNWCERADLTGRFHFETLQRLICKSVDTDGDMLVLPVLDSGFPQVQMLPTWRMVSPQKGAERFREGVRVDDKGVVLGYNISEEQSSRHLSVNEAFLIYDPDLYESYRGISPLRRGMNDARDAQDVKAFEKLAVKIHSALAAVIENGSIEENVWGDDTSPDGNAPAEDATPQEKKLTLAELLGGDIPVLPDGQTLKPLNSQRPNTEFQGFIEFLVGHFVSGLDVPPAFFLDEKLTGPNLRAVIGKAQRKFDQRIGMMCRLVRWLWVRNIAWAIDSGELPANSGFEKVTFQKPSRLTIDAGRETAQEREDVMNGLMTRQNSFGNRGLDWQRETDQSFAEDDYIFTKAKALADKHAVPVETILSRYGYETKPVTDPEGENRAKASDPNSDER